MPQHDAPDRAGLADDVAVGDYEAEADPRGDGFRQAADVDDPPARIHRPQRRGRSREVVDLRLVVVLQNEEIVLDRGLDQCPAPGKGHGHHGRKLVARSREHQLAAGRDGRRDQAVPVDGHPDQLVPRYPEGVSGAVKSRVLDGDWPVPVRQHHADDAQRVLCAERDEDLLVVRVDAAVAQHPLAQLLDEPRTVALHRVSHPHRHLPAAESLPRALPPGVDGEQVRIELVVDERVGIAHPVQRILDRDQGRRLELDGSRRRLPAPCRLVFAVLRREGHAQIGVDEVPGPVACDQEAELDQPVVGGKDGVSRDIELARKLPARWQRPIVGQYPGRDRRAHHLAYLVPEAEPGRFRQLEQVRGHRRWLSSPSAKSVTSFAIMPRL